MAERIDDTAKAREWLLGVDDVASPLLEATTTAMASMAQAHATLALVEQQRIANRLAVAQIDLLDELRGDLRPDVLSFRIRTYLSADDWASIDVVEGES